MGFIREPEARKPMAISRGSTGSDPKTWTSPEEITSQCLMGLPRDCPLRGT